jgi:hypothetical protein
MHTIHRLVVAGASAALLFLVPGVASGQYGPPPPPPPSHGGGGYHQPGPPPHAGGYHPRYMLTLGGSVGLGAMTAESGPIRCTGCDYEPISLGFSGHLGGMLSPRFALMGDVSVTFRNLDRFGFDVLYQTMLLGVAQYWLHPQFWIKGGLGIAVLGVQEDRGYFIEDVGIDAGLAIMGAAGFEVFSTPHFAVDLQLRVSSGSYSGIGDNVHSLIAGVGFNWF